MTSPVWISAASPLFQYSPTRNGPVGASWRQDPTGAICAGPQVFAVELHGIYFSSIVFKWRVTGSFVVSIGLDGQLQRGQSSSGATLSAALQNHDVRLEVVCESCTERETFTLEGGVLETALPGINSALDDSAAEITYHGFRTETAATSGVEAIRSGTFHGGTVSYTSSVGSTASFTFSGHAIHIFGPTGSSFGSFSVSLDNVVSSFNASTTLNTYNTLLFFSAGLTDTGHRVTLTSLDGLFALDYIVAVSGFVSSPNLPGLGTGGSTVIGGTTTLGSISATDTPVFPGSGPSTDGGNNGAAGLAIGLTLGILAAIMLLWLAWRWRRWKKAGGEGSFFVALCGARHRRKAIPFKEQKFNLWPMVRSRPKYATDG